MHFDPSCCSQILNKRESALIETDDYERGVKLKLMKDMVYYLPGMGGRLETGLGEGIIQRGYSVVGRATLGAFKKLRFQEKIDIVTADLVESFWNDSSIVVANSFGAYLFLHSQINMPPFPGKVILFSPVIGTATNSEIAVRFYPPRADVLRELALQNKFPKPQNAEIHVGSEDWQSGPTNVVEFAEAVGLKAIVVEGKGHMLGADYVGSVLDTFLKR